MFVSTLHLSQIKVFLTDLDCSLTDMFFFVLFAIMRYSQLERHHIVHGSRQAAPSGVDLVLDGRVWSTSQPGSRYRTPGRDVVQDETPS